MHSGLFEEVSRPQTPSEMLHWLKAPSEFGECAGEFVLGDGVSGAELGVGSFPAG